MGFSVSVKRTFAASHRIDGYPGLCARLHGHNWTIEAVFATDRLNPLGMAVDFHEIERRLDPLLLEVDHSHLNDHPFFCDKSTTAENIALFFYRGLAASLDGEKMEGLKLCQVSVWEMEGYRATYEET
ncbi:MAG: 6-carboxytetrahydropterin synthase [Nitrospiraceae bacterium]|jgi:6-pyruvoyltetrahydropterin/6-carboxytetrahydropterin synthase|nr:6-carboxytetrahydropterin synthase [Nitrospiraceae bacterium]